jgi:hypothetical protein
MQPRNPAVRKSNSPNQEPDRPPHTLLSVRSALVLTVALLIGFGGAALLYAAHRPVALVALGGLGFFGGALKLLDSMIELRFSIHSAGGVLGEPVEQTALDAAGPVTVRADLSGPAQRGHVTGHDDLAVGEAAVLLLR